MACLSWLAQRLTQRQCDSCLAGKLLPFESVRIRRVPAGDALDGRLEIPEAFFLDAGRQLRAETAEARGLVRDHAAPGLLHGRTDRVEVERRHGAHVDDLGIDSELLGGRFA